MKDKEVRGEAKSVRNLLGSAKFAIDYYQREYSWGLREVSELIRDLYDTFSEHYELGDEPSSVSEYGHYFLNSIIISEENGRKVIIDGQQRLTTLTLLLIYLYHRIKDWYPDTKQGAIDFSEEYGNRISSLIYFQEHRDDWRSRLNIPERTRCMKALFRKEEFDREGQTESVLNILDMYKKIEWYFPTKFKNESILCFTEWLLHKVYLVEITSYSGIDAFTIFETVNDRGRPLSLVDKLKGYLLFRIDTNQRSHAERLWHENIHALKSGGPDEPSRFIINWLLSQYAKTFEKYDDVDVYISHWGSKPYTVYEHSDFRDIQRDAYYWVRNRLKLRTNSNFIRFIEGDFVFYSYWYKRVQDASATLTQGLEAIYMTYGGGEFWPVKIPYVLFLAPLDYKEITKEIQRKLRIVAKYVDILIARHSWNRYIELDEDDERIPFSYGIKINEIVTPQLIVDIRKQSAEELVEILIRQLETEEDFNSICKLQSDRDNRVYIHRLLARITHFVETESGKRQSHYEEYLRGDGENWEYEIEHILPVRPKEGEGTFTNRDKYRDYIGGLLLLPMRRNRSFGAKKYIEKQDIYSEENLLAQSLHERAYQNNPGFRRFNEGLYKETGLKFEPRDVFDEKAILGRQELYRAIAKKIWDPETLRLELEN